MAAQREEEVRGPGACPERPDFRYSGSPLHARSESDRNTPYTWRIAGDRPHGAARVQFDVAITRDRKICGVFRGEQERAHSDAAKFVSAAMTRDLDGPVEAAIIAASPGYPAEGPH